LSIAWRDLDMVENIYRCLTRFIKHLARQTICTAHNKDEALCLPREGGIPDPRQECSDGQLWDKASRNTRPRITRILTNQFPLTKNSATIHVIDGRVASVSADVFTLRKWTQLLCTERDGSALSLHPNSPSQDPS
jgi:hypothetical protein